MGGSLNERFRVSLSGSNYPISSMDLVVKTYGKGVSEAMRVTQQILEEAQGATDGLEITSVEKI